MSEVLRMKAKLQQLELEKVECEANFAALNRELREKLPLFVKPGECDENELNALFQLILKEVKHAKQLDKEIKFLKKELGEVM